MQQVHDKHGQMSTTRQS